MPQSSRTFRIFVSSTFSDLKEERNALQEKVFPRLRDLAILGNCRFQAIDLRWGVSDEATLDQQTMKICLNEIKRCQNLSPRPNFIILLGDRYGWRPLPYEIPAMEFERILDTVSIADNKLLKEWYCCDHNALPPIYDLQARTGDSIDYNMWAQVEEQIRQIFLQAIQKLALPPEDKFKYTASATEQEIEVGALNVQDAQVHVFGYFRDIKGLPNNGSSKDFRDADPKAAHLQSSLKNRLKDQLSGNIHEAYQARWLGDGPSLDHLDQLCEDVYRDLSKVIRAEIDQLEAEEPLKKEISAHEKFGKERASFFVGREEILEQISDYMESNVRHPMVLWGASGSGKSALMAKAVQQAQERKKDSMYRFIGVTPESSNGRALLESLCKQISLRYETRETNIPSEYKDLVREFPNYLALATSERPLVLFLDALDQLSDYDHTRPLAWLPAELPPHVHLIISTAEGECTQLLEKIIPASHRLQIRPMSVTDAKAILDQWFSKVHRKLQINQEQYILDRFKHEGLPLYLKLAFEEAQSWKSYDQPATLNNTIPGILNDLFERLSMKSNHGSLMVSRCLGNLAAAKNGLSEDELLDVLSLDKDIYRWFLTTLHHIPEDLASVLINHLGPERCELLNISGPDSQKHKKVGEWFETNIKTDPKRLDELLNAILRKNGGPRLPVVLWSRLYSDLEPYLAWHKTDGVELMTFYHRQVAEAVQRDYQVKERHASLADYFTPQPLYFEQGGKSPNLRKLSEMIYQQLYAEIWSELEASISDLAFLDAKCQANRIFELLTELEASEKACARTAITQVRQALMQAAPTITERCELALQAIYNNLAWTEMLSPSLAESLRIAHESLETRPYWIRAAGQMPDSRSQSSLKLSFKYPSNLQSLSPEKKTLAVTSDTGECIIYNLLTGAIEEDRNLANSRPVVGIAHGEKPHRIAWIENDSSIHTDTGSTTLNGHAGERRILYPAQGGVLAVVENNNLVAWQAGVPPKPICELPYPLIVLRFGADGQSVIYSASRLNSKVGILRWDGRAWIHQPIQYAGPPIVDADLDTTGEWAVVLRKDHSLLVIELSSGQQKAQLFYERQGALVTGNPSCCAWGIGAQSDVVFFSTQKGQIGAWQWQTNSYSQCENGYELTEANSFEMLAALPLQEKTYYSTAKSASIVNEASRPSAKPIHSSEVSGCFITEAGNIVSSGLLDQKLQWSTGDGLSPIATRFIPNLALIAPCFEPEKVLVADKLHRVWEQSADREVTNGEIIQFHSQISGIFEVAPQTVIISEQTGRIQKVHLINEQTASLFPGNNTRKHIMMRPAKPLGLCWSVFQSRMDDGEWVLLLQQSGGREEEFFRSHHPIREIAVSEDENRICIVANGVMVYQKQSQEWLEIGKNVDLMCNHVVFVGRSDLLGMVFENSPYFEIRRAAGNMEPLASIRLPDKASCLTARKNRVALGFQSGDVISLCLSGRNTT